MNHLPRVGGRSLAAALAVVAAAALLLAARPVGRAADKNDPPVKEAASPLDFVPADASAVISVRVSDLWKHPAAKARLREKSGDELSAALKQARKQLGVAPDEIDRLIVFLPDTPDKDPLIAVTTSKPYDKKAVVAAMAPYAQERKLKDANYDEIKDRVFYVNASWPSSFAFLDDHTLVMAPLDQLEEFLRQPRGKTVGPLAPALRLADTHLMAAGVDAAAVMRAAPRPENLPPDAKSFKPPLKARFVTLTVDLDDKLRATAQATFATGAEAKDGAAAMDAALDMACGAFVRAMKELMPWEDAPRVTALLKDAQTALRTAKAERRGNTDTVQVETAVTVDQEATTAALAEAIEIVRKAAKRMEATNALAQVGLAIHAYAFAYNYRFPAAAVYDKNGKPLLSWRVTLLPYIGEGALYKEFHLDEPWDSNHNKKLLAKMPTTFAPPNSQEFKDHETHLLALVGKGTVFDGTKGARVPEDIPDGTGFTILFVEAKKGVPWTKPEDVSLDDGKLLPKLGSLAEGGFMAATCDGSVRFFPATMKEDTLRIWATRNNGQVRPEPEK